MASIHPFMLLSTTPSPNTHTGGTVWEGSGGVALVKIVCHGGGLEASKDSNHFELTLLLGCGSRCELSAVPVTKSLLYHHGL